MNAHTLIYIHLPKTGGTTFNHILERQYPAPLTYAIDGLDPRPSVERFRRLPADERSRYRCLKGMMSFGLHDSIPGPATYVTILRNPVERFVSLYHFARRATRDYLYPYVAGGRMTLRQFVLSDIVSKLHNAQTKMLAGVDNLEAPASAATLKQALRNIEERFLVAGLLERFDESVLLCQATLGWSAVRYYPMNVGVNRDRALDPEVARLIRERNHWDDELVEAARTRLEDQLRGVNLGNELARLRARNGIYVWNVRLAKLRSRLLRLVKSP